MRYTIQFKKYHEFESKTIDADQVNETDKFLVFTTFHGADDAVIREDRVLIDEVLYVSGVK